MKPADGKPSNQELRVLRALAIHGTVDAAAQALILSKHTVDAHIDHIRRKSGKHKIPQLVYWAAQHGWLLEEDTPEK